MSTLQDDLACFLADANLDDELAVFREDDAPVSELAVFLDLSEQEIKAATLKPASLIRSRAPQQQQQQQAKKPTVTFPMPVRPLTPDDFVSLLRQNSIAASALGGTRPKALATQPLYRNTAAGSAESIHAQQLRQITNDLRAGHCAASYPLLPVSLRLSAL
jgi:hypothetical protein